MRVLKNILFTIIKMVLLFVVVYKEWITRRNKTIIECFVFWVFIEVGTRFLRRR